MKRYRISEICDILGGGTPKTTIPEYWNGDIPWLSVKDFNNDDAYVYETEKKITQEGLKHCSATLLEKDDIVISARGTVGALTLIPFPMTFNQSCYGLRGKQELVDKHYLFYKLKNSFQSFLANSHGSVFNTITRDTFNNICIQLPDLSEQQRIAKILSTIDAKIELNKKINRELETMAKELYDYWFVQFDFPNAQGKPYKSSGGKMVWNETLKREIPEGWGICKLKDYINNISRPTLAGEHLRDMFYTPIDELPKRQMSFYGGLPYTDAKSSLQLYQENDILIGAMRVYFHRVCIAAQRGITRSTTIVLQIRNVKDLAFIYELLNDDQTIQYANKISVGTQQPYVNWDNAFDSMDVILPMNLIITAFCKKINPVIDKVKCLAKENYTLTRLRDYLLPLLMNGQVRVTEEKVSSVLQKDDTNRFILWKNTYPVAARGEKNDTVLRAMYDAMDDEDK